MTEGRLDRRAFVRGGLTALAACGLRGGGGMAHVPDRPGATIAFRNFRLFDGVNTSLHDGKQLFVRQASILAIEAAAVAPPADAAIIDCGGRVLMPGLIDAHYHSMFATLPHERAGSITLDALVLNAAEDMEAAIMRGYTTVRDVAGLSFALKDAIDRGAIAGPRIFPSGLAVSQTSGHGDFREPNELSAYSGDARERANYLSVIADGVDAVRRKVREQLFLGASQIKVMAGGGIISLRDPLDSLQYSSEELRAAVECAADWGTYVTVHAYSPRAMERAINAGVKCIEHGHLAEEATAKLMRDRGVWWSLQPFVPLKTTELQDPRQTRKLQSVLEGTDRAYRLAQRFGIRVAYGTDYTMNPEGAAKQSTRLSALSRWYDAAGGLRMATSENGALLAMSGPRNPYPEGPVGRIERGAYADILVVDAKEIPSLASFLTPETSLRLIMKDGRIFKNSL